MKLRDQLLVLKATNANVTIFFIGRNEPLSGTLSDVGDDYVTLLNGPEGPHPAQSLIPFTAIACVGTRT